MSNALAFASSPYLRQHAENPVNWLPWCEDSLERAKSEQKPIFLSIGYATCHWCHVMARECFEDVSVATLLNEAFISIKVDREERPDLDRVYMTYVQALSGRGGWPLNVWLTPELRPFFGGTYFPPEDRPGRPGFPRLLQAISQGWAVDRERFLGEAERVYQVLKEQLFLEKSSPQANPTLLDREQQKRCWQRAFEAYKAVYDTANGGFGSAPKFPQPANLRFLFAFKQRESSPQVKGEVEGLLWTTLRSMALGGLNDRVGGGFHRYSVDERWFLPHFEKMLYDQAQLACLYLEAAELSDDSRFAWVARHTLDYVLRDLRLESGAFGAAEDADSLMPGSSEEDRHLEGAFYLWSWEELTQVLLDDTAFAVAVFGFRPEGNIPEALDPLGEFRGLNLPRQEGALGAVAKNFNFLPEEAEAKLESILTRLAKARQRRPRPLRDDKVVVAWNGLLLSAFARALLSRQACILEQASSYRVCGLEVVSFIQSQLFDSQTGSLRRSWCAGKIGPEAVAEDYAFLIQGLLDLHRVESDPSLLEWALFLQERFDAGFFDREGGGYYDADSCASDLILRLKEDFDGAEPAASSIAALNLFRLAALTDREPFRRQALATLTAFRSRWSVIPQALPCLLLAQEWAVEETPLRCLLLGKRRDPAFVALRHAVEDLSLPPHVFVCADLEEDLARVRALHPWIPGELKGGAVPRLYLCKDYLCAAPVETPDGLVSALLALGICPTSGSLSGP